MKILYRRCAALDVHKNTVCACIRRACGNREVEVERATFRTFSNDLEQLGQWLRQHKVKRVAMESTGVYWIPVWNILEQKRFRLELLLVNPKLVKALSGEKTDQKDAQRIAELHQYGLLRGSFVPPVMIRELRDLVRRRVQLQRDRNQILNRIERLMQTVNLKFGVGDQQDRRSQCGECNGRSSGAVVRTRRTPRTRRSRTHSPAADHAGSDVAGSLIGTSVMGFLTNLFFRMVTSLTRRRCKQNRTAPEGLRGRLYNHVQSSRIGAAWEL